MVYRSPFKNRKGAVGFDSMYQIPSSGYADPANMGNIDRDMIAGQLTNNPLFPSTPRQFTDYDSLDMPMGQPMQGYMPGPMDPRGLDHMESAMNPLGVDFSGGSFDTGFDNLGLAPQMDQQARLSIAGLDPGMSMGEIGDMGIAPLTEEQIKADMMQLQSDRAAGRTERDRVMEQVGMNYDGPAPALQGTQTTGPYIAGLSPDFAASRVGQQRANIINAHNDFIKAHPPGSGDFDTYRQRLIDSGIFESDHILADQTAHTPGAPRPMTLPDALRKMYNVPKGQEIARDDIRGRAKGAAIKARRQEKSQAHKEVMGNFGGDYSEYTKWWNSLPAEMRPKTWGEARDAIRLGSVRQGGYQGETTGPGMLARDYQFQQSGPMGASVGVPAGIARQAGAPGIDPGRESLMSLSQGEMPENFLESFQEGPIVSGDVFHQATDWPESPAKAANIYDPVERGKRPGSTRGSGFDDTPLSFRDSPVAAAIKDIPTNIWGTLSEIPGSIGAGEGPILSLLPGQGLESLGQIMGMGAPGGARVGGSIGYSDAGGTTGPSYTQPSWPEPDPLAGVDEAQANEVRAIMEQARYGSPFEGAPDIQQFLAQGEQPTMRQATGSEARAARRGGSLADSLNEWNSVKDQLAQATMFDMHVPQEVKDIESRVKRDLSRVQRMLRQAPKRLERLRAHVIGTDGRKINIEPIFESILRGHFVDVPGKNYQRQMGATQTQDAAGLFEDRGPAGARSEVNQEVMRVAANLPKGQRAQFLRQVEWLSNFAAQLYSLGAAPRGVGHEPSRSSTLGFGGGRTGMGGGAFETFVSDGQARIQEIEEQVRGSRARRGRKRLRRQLKER